MDSGLDTFWRDPAQVNDVVQVSLALLGLRDEVEQLEDDGELPPSAPLMKNDIIRGTKVTLDGNIC